MVSYDKTVDARSYIEIITGSSYYIPEKDTTKYIKDILKEEGYGYLEELDFNDIRMVSESDSMFLLVEIPGSGKLKWFEIPKEITAADIDNYYAFRR